MSDRPDDPESWAGEPKPLKIKAEDNPWYLLATLYGVPELEDYNKQQKNRVAWNRYFAANLRSETRTRLINEKRHPEEELTPFSSGELAGIERAFGLRSEVLKSLKLPSSASLIDFSNVKFDQDVDFNGWVFADCSFSEAFFAASADFENAIFSGQVNFRKTRFADNVGFQGALFASAAYFNGVIFFHAVGFENASFLGLANFDSATFPEFDRVSFGSATFYLATFEHATFCGDV